MAEPRQRRWKIGCWIAVLSLFGFLAGFYGPALWSLYRHGLFDNVLHPPTQHAYEGNSSDNLKFMRTALLGYEESEGQFPQASGWMDAIQNRLNTDDLKKGEAVKKLIAPEYVGQADKFGYGFNAALSGKYHGDIKDPKTPLIYESTNATKNASGDPAKDKKQGGIAIAIDGTILK